MKQVAQFKAGTIYEYTIENAYLKVTALNFGATITAIYFKDGSSTCENMVASFHNILDYEKHGEPYLNAIVGPVAGRIAYGSYMQQDHLQHLSINNGLHHLHGGIHGISKKLFTIKAEAETLHFHLETTHDEDGFPKGVYTYDVTYHLQDNQLVLSYLAVPPATSLMNMTSHLYFNLSGNMKESIRTHHLWIPSTQIVSIHEDGHPYKITDIKPQSAFDFSTPRRIGDNYQLNDAQFAITKAYDTAFLLSQEPIYLYHETSGRRLCIQSDAPCVVMYTANYFDDTLIWQNGKHGYPMCAVALEMQDIPNGVNIKDANTHPFSDPKHPYRQKTIYTFDIDERKKELYGNNQGHCE